MLQIYVRGFTCHCIIMEIRIGGHIMTAELTGGFTLPGESGYEELTLKLAKKWGADVIRDSDGTALSDKIGRAHV